MRGLPDDAATRIVFGIFFVGAFLCLFSSAVFHLMCSHSYQVSLALNRCDYAGITLMIVGSSFPLIYFAFNCEYHLQVLYLTFITLCGAVSMPFIMMEKFATAKYARAVCVCVCVCVCARARRGRGGGRAVG